MSVFGSIFGKKGFEKGSHGVAMFFTAGAHSPRPRPGRSVWRTFISAAPRARRISARPVPKHNIGGAHPRALSPRRWAMPSGMSPQTGRSMIEMLAVLAIIGILSVVAVTGLMWAFAKHKANDTIHDVHLWEVAALDSNQLFDMTSGQLILPELGSVSTHGYPMAIWIESEDAFSVHVNDVPKRVCSLMLDMVTADQIVTVNDVLFESADICDAETNLMIFYLSKDQGAIDQACIPACSGTERCCGGECRTIQTPCGTDGCTDCKEQYCTNSNTCCDNPNAVKCGSEDCCESNCCNNVCCPSDQVCGSDGACACQNNLVMNPTTGLCECPADAPYYFEDANLCCKSGYTPVDGVCQKIDCRGGPTNYDCFINDKQCGYNCDSLGRNCVYGFCHADECPSDEPFVYVDDFTNYFYGCQKAMDENITCYKIRNRDGYMWRCSRNGEACCTSSSAVFECDKGTCDPQVCADIKEDAVYYPFIHSLGSCIFAENLICTPMEDGWQCLKNNLTCGSGCADPLNCGQCNTDYCPSSLTYNSSTGYCENNEYYCVPKLGQSGTEDAYLTCYQKKDDSACGQIWYTSQKFYRGSCTDPGCPQGTVFGRVTSGRWGCVNQQTGVACHYLSDYAPAVCYYNGSLCGRFCDYDGTDCGSVFLPQCALTGHCPQTGYDMSDGCTCDGYTTSVDGKNYCCPVGHTYTNGVCAMA